MPNPTAAIKNPTTSTAPRGGGTQNRCIVLIVEAKRKLSSGANTMGIKNALAILNEKSTNRRKIPVNAIERICNDAIAFGSSEISRGGAFSDSSGSSKDLGISDAFMDLLTAVSARDSSHYKL